MKEVSDLTVLVCDYGSFTSLAEKLGERCKRVLVHTPYSQEFEGIKDCVKGDGLLNVERCDEFLDPEILRELDLAVFPDIGFGGVQKHFRELGIAVWGSMGASELELYRTRFLSLLKELGLPMIHSEKIVGVTALSDHLKTVKDKWVKINRFRADMETWHHQDHLHSLSQLDSLAVKFGGLKEEVVFVVQDKIDSDVEIGYDGFTVDGRFPSTTFQGYEAKNELYLGSRLTTKELPDQIKEVNEALAPVLKEYGYRNFIATEIRVKDDVGYFIDPTMRMPGQTGEQLLETCENLAEVIWHGANGELVEPEFISKYAAEATLHYKNHSDELWKFLTIPEKVRRFIKLYHYCETESGIHFPPHHSDEVGVVLGLGDTIEDAIDHLKENLDGLGDEPVTADVEGFAELIEVIREAESHGMKFADEPIPEPEIAIQ